ANAVYFALKACENGLSLPAGLKVAAIGQATAEALRHNGIAVDLAPLDRSNSETFLALPLMRSVAGQRFLIVRGRGGRELLADTLSQRGARVNYAEVYQRLRPKVEIAVHLKAWRERGIDAVTIFSGESLVNFVAMLGDPGMAVFRNIPLFVVSERIAFEARRAGFAKVSWTGHATDRAMFEALARIADPNARKEAGFGAESGWRLSGKSDHNQGRGGN
ncbi:MAG: uroporphyrinogen-III synthase, partial [Methylococcales bacterium]